MQIVKHPADVLRAIAKPVEVVDEAFRTTAAEMRELLKTTKGLGLAAPQVGISQSFFVSEAINPDHWVYVNPVLSNFRGKAEMEEGCLSMPGVLVSIKRAAKVTLSAHSLDGQPITLSLGGIAARVAMHECDHLAGKLITDYGDPL